MVDLQNLRNSVKSFQDISEKQTKLFDDIEHLTEQLTLINSADGNALGNIAAGLREHLDSLRKLSDQHTSEVNDLSKSIDSIDWTQKELSLRKDADSFLKSNSYIWIIEDVTENVKKSELWSPEFYSSPLGYHLRCKLVFGDEHVGVHIQFVEGLYDHVLEWPCPQQIQVTLVNQVDEDGHIECILKSGNNDDSEPWSRPKKDNKQRPTVGKDNFITRIQLAGSKGDFKSCFVRNNRIYLQIQLMSEIRKWPIYGDVIAKISQQVCGLYRSASNTQRRSDSRVDGELSVNIGALRSDFTELLKENIFIFAVDGVSAKKRRLDVPSDPFFASAYGYKLQLQVQIDAESMGMFIKLVSGEFDEYLEWPFNNKIKLSVFNQVDHGKNKVQIMSPDHTNPIQKNEWTKPVINDTRVCRGYYMITLQELFGDDENVSHFLRNDRVLLKVELL